MFPGVILLTFARVNWRVIRKIGVKGVQATELCDLSPEGLGALRYGTAVRAHDPVVAAGAGANSCGLQHRDHPVVVHAGSHAKGSTRTGGLSCVTACCILFMHPCAYGRHAFVLQPRLRPHLPVQVARLFVRPASRIVLPGRPLLRQADD